jgi:hypothetical protein
MYIAMTDQEIIGWLRRGIVLNGVMSWVRQQQKKNNSERKHALEWVLHVCYDRQCEIQKEVLEVINQVDNKSNLRTILFHRYILMETWRDIAASLHYADAQYVNTIKHKKAIQQVRHILNERNIVPLLK